MDRLIPHMQKAKLGLHITQSVFIFVAWIITIVYLRRALIYGADIGWYFAMCFLSIPAIIYETLTSMYQRSRRWGNPYAFAAIDVLFTILWLSAWAAVAAWNSGDWCIGACAESKAMVGLGFMIFLFFGFTSAISVYGVIYYRQHGSLPGASPYDTGAAFNQIDPDREAFSTANDNEYMGVHMNDKDSFQGEHPNAYDTGGGAGLPAEHDHAASSVGGYDSSYTGAGASVGNYSSTPQPYPQRMYSPPGHEQTATQSVYATPAWEGQSHDQGGRVQFPAANY